MTGRASGGPVHQKSEDEHAEQENKSAEIPVAAMGGGALARGHERGSKAGAEGSAGAGWKCFMSRTIIESGDGFAAMIQVKTIVESGGRQRGMEAWL